MVGATTVAFNWSGYVSSFLHDRGIDLPARFLGSPGTVMIEVPDAVASELHLRHGWSMLSSVQDRLKEANINFSDYPQLTSIINLPAMVVVLLVEPHFS